MKNSILYNVVFFGVDKIETYNLYTGAFEKGLLHGPKYAIKEYFVTCAIMDELRKQYKDTDNIYLDSYEA